MLLYHYTRAERVLPIKEQGLLPKPDEPLSPRHPVVWLTAQPDVSLTAGGGNALAALLGIYEAPLSELIDMREGRREGFTAQACKQWWYGSKGERINMDIDGRQCTVCFAPPLPEDDLVRLTVQVPDDTNLHRYVRWPHRPKGDRFRFWYKLPHMRLWYIYLGRLSPHLITEVTPLREPIGRP